VLVTIHQQISTLLASRSWRWRSGSCQHSSMRSPGCSAQNRRSSRQKTGCRSWSRSTVCRLQFRNGDQSRRRFRLAWQAECALRPNRQNHKLL